MKHKTAFFLLSSLAVAGATVAACDTDTVPLLTPPDGSTAVSEGGGLDDTGSGAMPGQKGRIVDFGAQGMGVGGSTITIGGKTLMADSKGNYTVNYMGNTPVEMNVTAPAYWKLIEGEWEVPGFQDRGTTRLVSEATASSLLSALALYGGQPYDDTLGVISVWLIAQPPCTTDGDVKIEMVSPGAKTAHVYLKNGLPTNTLAASFAGENPHAAFYNVPVGPVSFTVTSPTCGMKPYPNTDDAGFIYTGKARVDAANTKVLSFFRVFLGAQTAATDGGTDGSTTDGSADDGSADAADGD